MKKYEIEQYKLLHGVIRKFFGVERRKVEQEIQGVKVMGWENDKLPALLLEMKELGLTICGGTINSIFTDATVNDLDFYMSIPTKQTAAMEFLQKWFPKVACVSKNAITYKRKSDRSNKIWTAQLILRFVGGPETIFKTFDFTITQGAYSFVDDSFYFGDRFFADLAKRRLVYLGGSRFPICAMYRTKKYRDRGYTLSGATVMHIALSIVQLEIKTYAQLKEQLMGVDTMFLQGLLGSERYADDLPVDYGMFVADAFEAIDGVKYADEDDEILQEI